MTKEADNTKKTVKTARKVSETKPANNVRKALPEPNDDDRVGIILRNERIKRGFELDEVAKKLCIRSGYLEAIESGNYTALPQMPYSAGFVSSYAKFLGLNHTRITQLFREEIHVKPKNVQTFVAEETPSEASVPSKPYVLIGVVMVALLAGLWMLFSPSSEKAKPEEIVVEQKAEEVDSKVGTVEYFESEIEQPAPESSDTVATNSGEVPTIVVAEGENADSSQIVVSEDNYVEDEPKQSGVEVKITSGDVWVEVKDANKIYLSKIMKAGSSYHLPDVKGLLLSVGKHVGVEVYVNGKLTPVIKRDHKLRISVDGLLSANH